MDIKDIKFEPEDVTVHGGRDRHLDEQRRHSAHGDEGRRPGRGLRLRQPRPGRQFEQTFDEAGEVDYVCTIHPGQEGTVTVE